MQNRPDQYYSAWLPAITGLLFLGAASVGSGAPASDPLLDLFIQKGFVTQQEAEKVKAEADAIRSRTNNEAMPNPEGSKWKLSTGIKSVELFGDIRMRFENRQAQDAQANQIKLNRLRYSVRLGLRGEVFDDYYYGVRLDTGPNPRSAWVSMGTSSSGAPFQGPFGKSTAGINVGQAYVGWRLAPWMDVTVGKMANPLYTTAMVWDSDINPEGVAERFKYTVGEADFFATFGQFLYQDTNPTTTSFGFFNFGQAHNNLPFLLAWQAGMDYHLTKSLSVKVAPVLYNYTGRGANNTVNSEIPGFNGTFIGQGGTNGPGSPGASGFPNGFYDGFIANQTGINDLLVLEIPFELNAKFDKFNVRLFGDYAQNLHGGQRADAAFAGVSRAFVPDNTGFIVPISSSQRQDTKAYQIGLAFANKGALGLATGSICQKHAWEVRTYWQHIEQYALDPNLLDSDFFEGRANMEGLYAALAYGLTDNMIGTIRYGFADRINDQLGTGGSNQDIPQINPIKHYSILQFDVTFRF
ncbi:MAG: hypothetical protein JWR69_1989 [Pedosphaera sp.]|nr:hypothetical protein [Pedosphaera sp.]